MARPKALDHVKKSEICALLTAGMSLARAARHVGCARMTIYSEAEKDAEFGERMRRARLAADLNPHEAMRRFATTHWRAAAWLLDREERREEARRARKYFTPADVDNMAEGVQRILRRSLVIDPWDAPTVAEQVDDLFRHAEPGKTKPPKQDSRRSGPTLAESLRFLQKRWAERAAAGDEKADEARPRGADAARANLDTPVQQFPAANAARGAIDPINTGKNGRTRGES